MFILSFAMALALTTWVINKKNDAEDQEALLYHYDRVQQIALVALLALGVLLEVLFQVTGEALAGVGVPVLVGYMGLCVAATLVLNQMREKHVQQHQNQVKLIYSAVHRCLGKKNMAEPDLSQVPFTFDTNKKGEVTKITLEVEEPNYLDEPNPTQAAFSLNKYLPHLVWQANPDPVNRTCVFTGQAHPPSLAKWVGSDLRPAGWIPLGRTGDGEVGWNMSNPDDPGVSSTINEDGTRLGTVQSSSAPQALGLGSTGGGKSIWVGSMVDLCRFGKDI